MELTTFLWAALATVAIIGIPAGIVIGLGIAKKGQQNQGSGAAANTNTGGATASPAQTQSPPTQTTAPTTPAKKFWEQTWFQVIAGIIILAALAAVVYILLNLFKEGAETITSEIPPGLWPGWEAVFGIALVALLGGIIWLFASKKVSAWLKALALMAFIVLLFPGFGQGVYEWFRAAADCWSTRVCEYGPSEKRVVRPEDPMVKIPKSGTDTFYVDGEIDLLNHLNYCLNISPEGAFRIRVSDDARVYHIKPKSGEVERAIVTSIREGFEDCKIR